MAQEADTIRARMALVAIAGDMHTDLVHAARVRGLEDLAVRWQAAADLAQAELAQLSIALRAARIAERLPLARAD